MWTMKKVEVIPIVVGALGAVSKKLDKWIEKLGIHIRIELLQKTALLGTARILRKSLTIIIIIIIIIIVIIIITEEG